MPPQTTPFNTHFESPPVVSGYRLWPEGKGAWGLVVPEATTNLFANSNAEGPITFWLPVNATRTKVSSTASRGLYSVQVVPSGTASQAEIHADLDVATVLLGQTYTFSCDVKGKAGESFALIATDDSVTTRNYGYTEFVATGDWQRVSVTYTSGATATAVRHRLVKLTLSTATFWSDGWQVENKSYATTFCAGDQPGCIWLGTTNNSMSQRAATAPGGRLYKFNDLGFQILNYVGAGMAQIVHSTTRRALLGGERYQRTTPQKTLITLNGEIQGYNLRQLEEVREGLIALMAPTQSTQQAKPLSLWFQLLDACGNPQGAELFITPAYYVGGLEGNVNNHYRERIALQFILPSTPAVKEVNQGAAALAYDISDTYGATAKKSMVKNVSNGAYTRLLDTGSAQAFVNDGFGNINFVNDSDAIYRQIVKSASGTYSTANIFTEGGFAGSFLCLLVDATGQSYIGGNFTGADGNYLLRYTSPGPVTGAGTFSAAVRAMCMDNFNTVYVTGDFVTITGNSRVRIAKGSGTTWSNLVSATGLSATGRALVKGQDGNIYIGGDFLTANGVTVNRIVRYNVASDTYTALPASGTIGMNGVVRALACGQDGKIYAGGDFTTSGGVTCNRIAAWNGTQWQPLGVGLNGAVYSLSFDNQGNLYAAGQFTGTSDGTQTFPGKAAIWNGSTWHGLDYAGGSNPNFDSIWVDKILGDVYFGAQVAGYTVADRPGLTDVVYTGSAGSNPKIVLTAPGVSYTLWQISNITTGKNIYFNNYQVYNGETITLTLEPGNFSIVSSTKGDISWAILPGSDISSFTLEPGTNRIEVFAIEPTAAATVTAYWDNKHWSIDAGAY